MSATRSSSSQPQQLSSNGNSAIPSNNNNPTSSSSSSSNSGFFRQRNGSGVLAQSSSALFDRFRRPRTATNGSSATNIREAGNLGSGGIGSPTRGTDYSSADSTRQELTGNNTADSPSRGNRLSQFTSRSGLPRSNSSSQVFIPSADENTTSPPPTSRKTGMPSHGVSQSQSNIRIGGGSGSGNRTSSAMSTNTNGTTSGSGLGFPLLSRTGSSQGNPTGGPPTSGGFSRMFRRYSQGAGRNMTTGNETQSIAAANSSNNISNSNSATNLSSITNDAESTSNNRLNVSGNQIDDTSSQRSSVALPTSGTMLNVVGNTHSGNSSTNNINASNEATRQSNESAQSNQAHRVRLVPHLEATRSLHFEPIERDLIEGSMAVKIGRFTDRGQGAQGNAAEPSGANGATVGMSSITASASVVGSAANSSVNTPGARGGAIPSSTGGAGRVDTGRIAFKSKVVSRGHAEIWSESGGKVFIRDTKSSSGTFLNHIRLSAPNVESKPFQIKDGDVVQLGVDYQGGTEEIYRCVKMRVELNRGWQRGANQFNVNALRQLRALQGSPLPDPATAAQAKAKSDAAVAPAVVPTNRQSLNVTDCCICLFSVTVCQALFIAPCSHVFHYKCIRPLLNMHHPGFSCPLCRTFADLEEDVEEDEAWQQALLKEAGALDQNVPTGIPTIDASTPMNEEPLPSLLAVAFASSNSSEAEHFVDAAGAVHSTAPSMNSSHDQTSLLGTSGGGGNVSGGSATTDMSLGAGRRRSSAAESFSASRDSRHTPSSRRSGSSHRDSPIRSTDVHMIKRPDTAVSSSTAVPFGNGDTLAASSHASPRRSSRSRGSGLMSGYGVGDGEGTPNGEEETQELIFDEGSSAAATAAALYDQSASGPIDITLGNQSNSASAFSRHLIDGLTASPGLNDSRTPQNEHFLSTLAEAPVASRNVFQSSS